MHLEIILLNTECRIMLARLRPPCVCVCVRERGEKKREEGEVGKRKRRTTHSELTRMNYEFPTIQFFSPLSFCRHHWLQNVVCWVIVYHFIHPLYSPLLAKTLMMMTIEYPLFFSSCIYLSRSRISVSRSGL